MCQRNAALGSAYMYRATESLARCGFLFSLNLYTLPIHRGTFFFIQKLINAAALATRFSFCQRSVSIATLLPDA
jgi:hypothetical protein